MNVQFHELTRTDACVAKRGFNYELTEAVSPYVKKAGIVKAAIAEYYKGLKEEGLEKYLQESFADLEYVSNQQREYHVKDALRQILRYVHAEDFSTLVKGVSANVNLGHDLTVHLRPSFVRVTSEEITVIQIKCSKPNVTQKNALSDLGLYALFCYGKALVKPGNTCSITAAYYYLRKENDSTNTEKPRFDEDFFKKTGGRNIVAVTGTYTNGPAIKCEIDELYEQSVMSYVHALPKEECTKEDCEKCNLQPICKFTISPLSIVKTPVKKSLRDLDLTPAQEKVVEYEKGICRVNAGAGAGKTMVVALRTATLLNKGVKPKEMLLITFTNAGAEEMRNRISAILEDFGINIDIRDMRILTFNAFGDMILKKEFNKLGFTQEPMVIDDIERSRIIADLLNKSYISDLDYRNFDTSMATCMGALAIAKLVFQIVKAGQYSVSDAESVLEKMDNKARFTSKKAVEQLIALYDEYDDKLKKENLIEFSDQEVLLFELLHRNPFYMERFGFKHVIVDEFQDSSAGQIELIKKIIETPTFQSLMVVGDDSQAIFSFRDTTPEYILNFASIIGRPVDDIMLMENHRSTPEVLNAANNINNLRSDRVKKDLIATRTSGKPVVVKGFLTKVEEKDYVIKQIKEYLLDGVKAEDIAIIAATKYELMDMADKLSQEDIQTVMLNPEPLMENSRVVAALALCTAINVPDDTKDMLTYANARMTKHNLLDAPRTVIEYVLERIAQEIEAFHNLTEEEKKKEHLMKMLKTIDENEDEVYESFLATLERKQSTSQVFKYCNDFKNFGSSAAYRRTHNYPGVVLTTAHSSKGLEWPIVFNMISKYDGPELYHGSKESRMMVEERKRLLFVSMTRARDELIITGQFVSHGKRGEYTYNQFLEAAYECVGQHFSPEDVEKMRKERDEKKKAEKLLQKAKEEADNLSAKIDISSVS